jgi:hypothetical protein
MSPSSRVRACPAHRASSGLLPLVFSTPQSNPTGSIPTPTGHQGLFLLSSPGRPLPLRLHPHTSVDLFDPDADLPCGASSPADCLELRILVNGGPGQPAPQDAEMILS